MIFSQVSLTHNAYFITLLYHRYLLHLPAGLLLLVNRFVFMAIAHPRGLCGNPMIWPLHHCIATACLIAPRHSTAPPRTGLYILNTCIHLLALTVTPEPTRTPRAALAPAHTSQADTLYSPRILGRLAALCRAANEKVNLKIRNCSM